MKTTKQFIVTVRCDVDFCESDLAEAIEDGVENVGNFSLYALNVKQHMTKKSKLLKVLIQEAILKHNHTYITTHRLLKDRYSEQEIDDMWVIVKSEVDDDY